MTNTNPRACKRCDSVAFRTENKTFKNGTEHIARFCLCCGAFMDYAAKEFPDGMFVMPFGRHRGKSLDWILENERDYAVWLASIEKGSVSKRMQRLLTESVRRVAASVFRAMPIA